MEYIYLIKDNENLIRLSQVNYESENLLQTLIAKYPDLLLSHQIGDEPRRWLLISREMPVPDIEDYSSNRWSLDHLFLDQDGIPTLIEVKRSSDTRIRREVVGQMLDYAANAVSYWKPDEIRVRFEASLPDTNPADILAEKLGVSSANIFWQQVETNLRAGKIRMIFVADEIPQELRRIVEFLNEQMSPAEVLAIAIRQYAGEDSQMLVPTLYGQTAKAQGIKSNQGGQKWSEETFFPEIAHRHSQEEAFIAHTILDWAQSRGLRIWWGEGKRSGSFFPVLDKNGLGYLSIAVWTYGKIELQFQYMQNRPPFDNVLLRHEFLEQLNQIPGISLPEDGLTRRPSFAIRALLPEENLKQFIAVLDWFVDMVLAQN